MTDSKCDNRLMYDSINVWTHNKCFRFQIVNHARISLCKRIHQIQWYWYDSCTPSSPIAHWAVTTRSIYSSNCCTWMFDVRLSSLAALIKSCKIDHSILIWARAHAADTYSDHEYTLQTLIQTTSTRCTPDTYSDPAQVHAADTYEFSDISYAYMYLCCL